MIVDPLAAQVGRAQSGDQDAFAELVEATYRDVYNVAFQVLGNAQEAEDTTQQVYLRVWRALPSFRGQSRFSTWLYRVALNTSLNQKRALRSQWHIIDDEERLLREPAHSGDPYTSAVAQDRKHRLQDAVAHLPEKYRVIIGLFYQQQLGYEEISDLLTLPLGTVKAHLNRARKALARCLSPGEGNGDDDS